MNKFTKTNRGKQIIINESNFKKKTLDFVINKWIFQITIHVYNKITYIVYNANSKLPRRPVSYYNNDPKLSLSNSINLTVY